jgi:hypothetical protein
MIDDARRNGQHLRTTWHAGDRVFVVSTWSDRVCTSAVRVPVEEAADLATLLVDGLGEAAGSHGQGVGPGTPAGRGAPGAGEPVRRRRPPGRLQEELQVWARFARSRWRALRRDRAARDQRSGLGRPAHRNRHAA